MKTAAERTLGTTTETTMKDMSIYSAAAAAMQTTPGAVLLVQTNIAWAEFQANPTNDRADNVIAYLQAFKAAKEPDVEPVKRRSRRSATPAGELGDQEQTSGQLNGSAGTGSEATAGEPVMRRRRRHVVEQPAEQPTA